MASNLSILLCFALSFSSLRRSSPSYPPAYPFSFFLFLSCPPCVLRSLSTTALRPSIHDQSSFSSVLVLSVAIFFFPLPFAVLLHWSFCLSNSLSPFFSKSTSQKLPIDFFPLSSLSMSHFHTIAPARQEPLPISSLRTNTFCLRVYSFVWYTPVLPLQFCI